MLPQNLILKLIPKYGLVVAINEEGKVVETLQDPSGQIAYISEAKYHDGYLYFGSYRNQFLARVKYE